MEAMKQRARNAGAGGRRHVAVLGWGVLLSGIFSLPAIASCSVGDDPTLQGSGGQGGESGAGGQATTGGQAGAPAGAVCGNNLIEAGEACDGPTTLTCGMAMMNTSALGNVTCKNCQLDISACHLAGAGGTSGAGAPGTGANGGIVMGSGGITGAGGTVSSGGLPAAGGATGAGGSGAGGMPGGGTPGSGGTSTGGMSGTGGSSVLGDVDALRQTCLDTINMYRAMKGVAALTLAAATVETCSDKGAQADATAGVAHGSAGKCPNMRAQDTCPGWPPKQYGGAAGALKSCLMSMWAEGEPPEGRDKCLSDYFAGNITCFETYGHYLNMSDPGNKVVSCGFYVMPNGSLWMNQDLGG
jgi:hypothetical protein